MIKYVACVIMVFFIINMKWFVKNDFPCFYVKFVLFSCECGAFSWEEGDLYVEMHLIFKCTFDCEVAKLHQ